MYILGITSGMHDSSAALVKSGRIIAFAEEERFNRVKHTGDIPLSSIRFCLDYAKISPFDISAIGFFWRPLKGLLRRLYWNFRGNNGIELPFDSAQAGKLLKFFIIPEVLKKVFGFRCRFEYLDHYQCHLESVFSPSPFEKSLFLIADGNGEEKTLSGGFCSPDGFRESVVSKFPHSIGLVYMSVTEYLGFRPNSDEGKTMGLAPYGDNSLVNLFRKLMKTDDDGRIFVDLRYFDYQYGKSRYVNEFFESEFGKKRRRGEDIRKHHRDVAFALQSLTEDIVEKEIDIVRRGSNIDRFVFGGGVFLNSVLNYKILKKLGGFDIFIPPWISDAGTAIGAALILSRRLDREYKRFTDISPYLGPEYRDEEIETVLRRFCLKYTRSKNIFFDVASRIALGKIVGWFQGRMEAGPRALGNRSILADPRRKDMKDILNHRVKHREGFRPYAPSVLFERQREFFDIDIESPFMLFACNVKENRRELIPAVVHVDGTSRIQSVTEKANPRFYKLIREFEKIAGIPLLLNTSFNVDGEPIVCTPEDAVKCFLNSELDILAIGDFLVEKT